MRKISAGASLLLAVSLWPVTASATVVDSGLISDTFTFTEKKFCEVPRLTVVVDGSVTSRFRVVGHGKDGVPYYAENTQASVTYTNNANGAYVTQQDYFLSKDHAITDNGDGTFTIRVLATGGSSVRDSDGNLIAANPGQTRYEVVVDADGNQIGDLVVVKESTGRTDDFCAAVVSALT